MGIIAITSKNSQAVQGIPTGKLNNLDQRVTVLEGEIGTGAFLKLDQTTPQNVTNGAPTFQAGLYATDSGGTASIDTVNRFLSDITALNVLNYFDLNGTLTFGDVDNVQNNTQLAISDFISTVDVRGLKNISSIIVPFTGTGLDDLTWGGTYTGYASNNYTVWIDSINNQTITYTPPSSPSGLPLSGLVDNGAGVTATVVSDDTLGTLIVTGITGGAFSIADTLTDGSGNSIVVGGYSALPDTFAWQDTLGNSATLVDISALPQPVGAFGISITFGATTTHDIGSIVAGWEEDWFVAYGRMANFDGQNKVITIGDIDTVNNSTFLVVDDGNKQVYTTNTFSTATGSLLTAGVNTTFGDGNIFTIKMEGITIQHFVNTGVHDGTDYTLIATNAGTIQHNVASAGSKIRIICPGSTNFIVNINCFWKVLYVSKYTDGLPAFIIHDINYV